MNGPNDTNSTDSPREMNWKLLRPYERGLQVVGWLLTAYFAFAVVGFFYQYLFLAGVPPGTFDAVTSFDLVMVIPETARESLLPGLVLLILAQLIRCLTEKEYSPGRMLRHGHWILLLYGTLLLVRASWRGYSRIGQSLDLLGRPVDLSTSVFSFVYFTAAPTLVKTVLVFGVALILRRVVSIIEESKTLV